MTELIETKEQNIPNWTMFGSLICRIQLFETETEDLYQSALMFILDDGTEDVDKKEYCVTIFTQMFHTNLEQLAKVTFLYASTLFPNMTSDVDVYDIDGNQENGIELDKINMVPNEYSKH